MIDPIPFLSGIKVGSQDQLWLPARRRSDGEHIHYTPTGIDFTARTGESSRIDSTASWRALSMWPTAWLQSVRPTWRWVFRQRLSVKGIAGLEGIPGRMERIDLGQPFTAIVDFAHTPNALKVALEALRPMTRGRLIAVYGSAGLRDQQKRRMMAETSAKLADISILTAEDPRTEYPGGSWPRWRRCCFTGRGGGQSFFRVPDRGEAIRQAVRMAQTGDMVVACGKGHEQSMCFGETEYPWDDRTAMRAALSELMGIEGIKMPYLPTQD